MDNRFTRRNALVMFGMGVAGITVGTSSPVQAASTQWWTTTPQMDAMTAIRTRRSVRSFTGQPVSEKQILELLGAAMAAPSAGNEQPWSFVVVRDSTTLEQVSSINKSVGYAKKASLGILVCGDLTLDRHHGFWIQDVSAATQNLLLAAHALGLGAVWTGVYPSEERTGGFRKLFALPENIVPVAFVVIGHPLNTPAPQNRFRADRVHHERW